MSCLQEIQPMTYFSKHLGEHLNSLGKSQYRLAKDANIPQSDMSNLCNGKKKPTPANIQKLASVPWLGLTIDELDAWRLKDVFTEQAIELASLHRIDGLYRIPLKGTVSAGGLTYVDSPDDIVSVDWYGISEISNDLFALKVQGDSMEPVIPNGAFLLVRRARGFKDRGIYVIETENNETTVKMVKYAGAGTLLIPLNPNHHEITIDSATIRQIYQVLQWKVDVEDYMKE